MTAVYTIQKVLASKLLIPEMVFLPEGGATIHQILDEEAILRKRLANDHKAVLQRWNGTDLDIIRLYGCGRTTGRIGRISQCQINLGSDWTDAVVFGSNYAGFTFAQSGQDVISIDSDGGETKVIARSIDDFIDRVVFGLDAQFFFGNDWLEELRAAGICET